MPNTVLEHYTRLGITDAELLVLIHLWSYWWGDDEPCPAIGTLATRLGKTERQVQNLTTSLRAKGLLGVRQRRDARGGQLANAYDLRPFLNAIESVMVQQGVPPKAEAREAAQGASGGPVQTIAPNVDTAEDQFVLDSDVPHTPTQSGDTSPEKSTAIPDLASESQTCGTSHGVAASGALISLLGAVGQALGDAAPRSSLTRALRLQHATAIAEDSFLALIARAAAAARGALPDVVRRHPDGGPNGMPYFFATLEAQLRQHEAEHCRPPESIRMPPATGASLRQHGPRSASVPAMAQRGVQAQASIPPGSPAAGDPPESHPLWPLVLEDLKETLAPAVFAGRVLPLATSCGPAGELIIRSPTRFACMWVERQLGRRIRELVERHADRSPAVVMVTAHENEPTSDVA